MTRHPPIKRNSFIDRGLDRQRNCAMRASYFLTKGENPAKLRLGIWGNSRDSQRGALLQAMVLQGPFAQSAVQPASLSEMNALTERGDAGLDTERAE